MSADRPTSVIVAGARTPMGRLLGSLKGFSGADLGGVAIKGALADQLIRAGEFEIVVAGGQESMTNAPHLLEKSREGFKYGDVSMRDHMAFDGLWDAFTDQAMGLLTEKANQGDLEFTRDQQDEYSARSH